MSIVSTTRKLKRQASSDIEEAPVKQARMSVQNAHACRYPPLRRSDSQALDINATTPVVEHLPDAHEPVPVPSELQHRVKKEEQDDSTDEESQDEEAAWDRRAKAHRHHMLFKRPREPAPKVKPRPALLIKTPSEIAFVESDSEDEQPLGSINAYGTGEAAARRAQQLAALRAARASAPKRPQVATAISNTVRVPSINTVTTTTRHVTRTTTVTTTSVAGPAVPQNTPSMNVSERPRRQNTRVRQGAIDIIAGHRATAVPSIPVDPWPAPAPNRDAPLSSTPSQILRRSRRVAARQQQL